MIPLLGLMLCSPISALNYVALEKDIMFRPKLTSRQV